jgi:hypothetical protein
MAGKVIESYTRGHIESLEIVYNVLDKIMKDYGEGTPKGSVRSLARTMKQEGMELDVNTIHKIMRDTTQDNRPVFSHAGGNPTCYYFDRDLISALYKDVKVQYDDMMSARRAVKYFEKN